MRHVLSALVQNQPGVLAHISGMLASRGFNIDSLAVGETEVANLSRMTFVVHGDDAELEQVRKQLHKVVTVVKVHDISSEDFVERDLMLVKVKAAPQQRMEISLLVKMYRGHIVDISPDTLMIEISGKERKIEAFIELMRPLRHRGTGAHRPNRLGPRAAWDERGRPMTTAPQPLLSATRTLAPQLVELIRGLQPGQRIRITQRVRIGSTATWTATAEGAYRNVNFLSTGLSTNRVPEDDIVVVTVHFTKDNGELSSVTLDEHSKIELAGGS